MITKIVPGDVFSPDLQAGEVRGQPIDIIAGTNQAWENVRGVAHQIGQRFNPKFLSLLQEEKAEEVALGHVFSGEGMIDAQPANFHAIAVNRRLAPGGPQDWSELLTSLTTGLDHIHLRQSIYGEDQPSSRVDTELQGKIAAIQITEYGDYATEIARVTREHIEKTRRKFRVVLIGGADGTRNQANLQHTLEALETSPLMLHLYLGYQASVARAVSRVIPHIPTLRARQLEVSEPIAA